ncbi:MAG: YqgE/AlgH family protein [Phycisphaerae bacterium]
MLKPRPDNLQGFVLLAAPELEDANFRHALILILRHDEQGALGIILNRPMETTVEVIWNFLGGAGPCPSSAPLYQGGPCESTALALHDHADMGDQVCPGIYFTGDATWHGQLLEQSPLTRIFIGYAGWGPGQLESELAIGSWYVAKLDNEQLLATPPDLWEVLMEAIHPTHSAPNVDQRFIPPDPSLN